MPLASSNYCTLKKWDDVLMVVKKEYPIVWQLILRSVTSPLNFLLNSQTMLVLFKMRNWSLIDELGKGAQKDGGAR